MGSYLNRRIFVPSKGLDAVPQELGLGHEEVRIISADGTEIHGWFFPQQGQDTFIFFHGNAGNVSHYLDLIPALQTGLGVSILLFDYRGYGMSEGSPTERGVYLDAAAAIDWVERRTESRRIVYYGLSLGAAIAIEMAIKKPPAVLIVEAAFASISDMAVLASPIVGFLARPWLRGRFDNISKVSRLGVPTLFIHGDDDEVVPFEHSLKLYRAAARGKEFYGVRGAAHTQSMFVGEERYLERLRNFMERAFSQGE